jgi:hypothetical protein
MDINLKIKHDVENPLGDNLWVNIEIMPSGCVNIYEDEYQDELLYSIGFEELKVLYEGANHLRKSQKHEFTSNQVEDIIQQLFKHNKLTENHIKRLP